MGSAGGFGASARSGPHIETTGFGVIRELPPVAQTLINKWPEIKDRDTRDLMAYVGDGAS